MSRKQPKRTAGNVVFKTMAGVFISAVICGVGFGVAAADSSDDVARAGALGFDEATQTATSTLQEQTPEAEASEEGYYEQSVLVSASPRTIDTSIEMIEEREEAERLRIEAEKEAERLRIEAEKEAERKRIEAENAAALQRVANNRAMQGMPDYGLSEVDWSVGREAFVAEWTSRIDAYLSGSALSGYGYAFAEAAWDYGVDPRWSPAIADTESGRGSVCFLPCNAWGWGQSSWDDWDSAIRSHVRGLAEGYGYSLTSSAAVVYCPPNSGFWYSNTYEKMCWI